MFRDGSKDDGPGVLVPAIEFEKEFNFLVSDFVYIRHVLPNKDKVFGFSKRIEEENTVQAPVLVNYGV